MKAADNLTMDDLIRLVKSLGPPKPHPVVIVARWMRWMPREMEILKREKDGRTEWRLSPRAWDVMLKQAATEGLGHLEPYLGLVGVPVVEEDTPPADFLDQWLGPMPAWLSR